VFSPIGSGVDFTHPKIGGTFTEAKISNKIYTTNKSSAEAKCFELFSFFGCRWEGFVCWQAEKVENHLR
jgi:hypothetical protein